MRRLKALDQAPITYLLGEQTQKEMNAEIYLECSAKYRENVEDIFREATKRALAARAKARHRSKKKKHCTVLWPFLEDMHTFCIFELWYVINIQESSAELPGMFKTSWRNIFKTLSACFQSTHLARHTVWQRSPLCARDMFVTIHSTYFSGGFLIWLNGVLSSMLIMEMEKLLLMSQGWPNAY